ncbi:DUF2254 domain-containing protein [Nakamurella flavida]|uniref:DUF2254 domain-containing protein n=1 Tax=Nakamurella flavida TaxID=363630 RepID=A0A938YHE6_9ACTN|nr:DUF2254 domain-containing protein [Nakamurella flavida]MBM9475134.1 DUF2254 domain-containing protein [Nakamurella flavida]MDP9776704.1 putative membrane protein [Nakamurella flavida]
MSMRSRAADAADAFRTQLWPVPVLAILVALVAGVLLPQLDTAIDDHLSEVVSSYLFGGGASAARTVLDAIASSLITVTSLTFSLTVVTLQLASGQFSPRLLRTFTRDRFVHVTLGLFLATFVYALTVLRTVRSPDEQQEQFVPQVSVTLAFALAVASVVTLVLFLAHLAREIRVETMVRSVHRDASSTVSRLLTEPWDTAAEDLPSPPPWAALVVAQQSGFLTSVDMQGLTDAVTEQDGLVRIDQLPGGFVVRGTPLGCCWVRSGSDTTSVPDDLVECVGRFLTIGVERTDTQDFAFGLRQLTDVAAKALSPGVNDPTTAIHALGHTSALLCEIAGRDLSDQVHRDEEGVVRVIRRRPTFDSLLDEAVAQPRRYGAADPAVLTRIMALLREVAWSARTPDHGRSVSRQLDRLRGTIASADFDRTETDELGREARAVTAALEGRWPFGR